MPGSLRIRFPFLAGLAFLVFYLISFYSYPSLGVDAEMWAEAGNVYFAEARTKSALANLFSNDFGYIPFIPRAIAALVNLVNVPPLLVPLAYQITAHLGIALAALTFVLPIFRKIVPSDLLRALVGLSLCCHVDYELKAFINFTYFGAVPLFLFLLVQFELRTFQSALVGFALGVIALSKGAFIAYVLPVGAALVLAFKSRSRSSIWVYAILFVVILLQCISLFVFQSDVHIPSLPSSTVDRVWNMLASWFVIGLQAVVGPLHPVAVAVAGYLFYRSWRADRRALILTLSLAGIVAGCSVVLTVAAFRYAIPFGTFPKLDYHTHRHWFIAATAFHLGWSIVLLRGLAGVKHIYSVPLFCLWLFFTGHFSLRTSFPKIGWPLKGYSNWMVHGDELDGDVSCLPLNPYPWLYGRNCYYLTDPPPAAAVKGPKRRLPADPVSVPSTIHHKNVTKIGVVFRRNRPHPTFLEVFDLKGDWLGRANLMRPSKGSFFFFRFDRPVAGIHALRFGPAGRRARVVVDSDTDLPIWVWMGLTD